MNQLETEVIFTSVEINYMCLIVSDFETFGKPRDFDKTNKLFDVLSIFNFFCYLATITLLSFSNAIQINLCRRENETRGINEICGMIGRMWLPFNYDYYPLKQIVFLYQVSFVKIDMK